MSRGGIEGFYSASDGRGSVAIEDPSSGVDASSIPTDSDQASVHSRVTAGTDCPEFWSVLVEAGQQEPGAVGALTTAAGAFVGGIGNGIGEPEEVRLGGADRRTHERSEGGKSGAETRSRAARIRAMLTRPQPSARRPAYVAAVRPSTIDNFSGSAEREHSRTTSLATAPIAVSPRLAATSAYSSLPRGPRLLPFTQFSTHCKTRPRGSKTHGSRSNLEGE